MGLVDLRRYPIDRPGTAAYEEVVARARAGLRADGCAVIEGLLREDVLETIDRESAALLDRAHVNDIQSNPYSTRPDPSLPQDHPVNLFLERTNAFVPTSEIPRRNPLRRLYHDAVFKRFVADCLERSSVHEYADPFAALVLNLLRPGCQHPWHYDTNEFIVSTLVHGADEGGVFEYCPQIRSTNHENFDAVRRVIQDEDRGPVRQLRLRPGDLQLFRGRFSLHRVTRVGGASARVTAIFAYADRPGVVGKVERTRQLFGRVAPEHLAAANQRRTDGLVD